VRSIEAEIEGWSRAAALAATPPPAMG
jgi:hypothetical protein